MEQRLRRSRNLRGRPSTRIAITCVLVASVVLLAAEAAWAGPPGVWTRISDPTGSNTDQAGLARTPDGVLHVAWLRKNGDGADLMETAIAKSGRVAGSPVSIVTGWSQIDNPALVVSSDGSLRAVFGGTRSTDPGETNTSMNTATAGEDGAGWTLVSGSIVHTTDAYASPAGAALEPDGTPVATWATTYGLGIHVGLDPSAPDQILQSACCAYQPQLATDASSGRVVLGWDSNASGASGIFAQAVVPAGPKQSAPGSASSPDADGVHTAIGARLGAPGVYLAYCGGGTTFCRTVLLWRYGGGAPLVAAKAPDSTTDAGRRVMLAPGPQGRLWVAWERGGRIFAARSNKTVTRFGPTVSTAPPHGTSDIWKLGGDGGNGPLDLLASVDAGGIATWHTQLLPPLTLTATLHKAGKKRRLVIHVSDAGDPVPSARIRFAGSVFHGLHVPRPRLSNAHGVLSLTLPAVQSRRTLTLVASEAGYSPGRKSLPIR